MSVSPDQPSDAPIPFAVVAGLCAAEGLTALAVLAPPPATFDPVPLAAMLAEGVGDMAYLHEHTALRLEPTGLLPSARAILAVALPYQSDSGSDGLRRARYAAGKDYHNLLRPKLGRIGRALEQRGGWNYRAACDSAPLNERTLAQLAGLGWLGRNGLLIAPDAGSYRVLGFLLTEAPLAPRHGGHGEDRCGRCTACETRCPTAAISGRRVISERCISYLTIEHRGVIPRALAERFAGWWFGCDLCQEVCPWNRFAPPAGDARLLGADRETELLAVRAETFDAHFAARAIRRIGYERFRRNLLVALWSLGRHDDYRPIIAEALPLVTAQAQELGTTA
ncbi:MAG: tRNA epoxyqueuosine(34) reductase QueG [Planctomycetes bacterium]|nr:tRNA epoxyqueuosine(34) reductase QueG [Planctomycetota bacterium]